MLHQAGKEDFFICALEEEAIEVECLLVEPQTDHASVDGVFFYPKENLEHTEIVHMPCAFEQDRSYEEFEVIYDHFIHPKSGQDTNAAGEGEDMSEFNVLDVLPHEVEIGNLHVTNGASTACEDYLLDTGFAETVGNLDYGSSGGLHLGFVSNNNSTFGASTMLIENVAASECRSILDKTSLHCSFSFKCEPETSDQVKCISFSTLSESHDVEKWEDDSNLLERGLSSDKNEKGPFSPSEGMSCSSRSVDNSEAKPGWQVKEMESRLGWDVLTKTSSQESNIGDFLMQKRSRKPTRRYIDESAKPSSRCRRKRQEKSSSTSKGKILGVTGVQCLTRHRNMGSKGKMLSADEPFGKAIQVPFDSQGPTECPKKHSSILIENSREEFSPDASDDKDSEATPRSIGGSGKRKIHRVWTISEVRTLVDGVSCYGVGRWTEIKKFLFSSSDHRTAVDLKDKWRNLLKASCAVKQGKREDGRKTNQPWRPLPKSVLCRVRELATVYPYPREAQSKISKSNDHRVRSCNIPARTDGFSENVVHGKICT